uniref:Uncharacterized protein n=1 Tax=Solanum lycopersicum TaxID=4081 RepID=A0A3Q7GWL2_SOLLC
MCFEFDIDDFVWLEDCFYFAVHPTSETIILDDMGVRRFLFTDILGECTMTENIIVDKVIGESGATNSNEIEQSQTIESKVKKGRKKRSRAWDHFTRKTDSDGSEKAIFNYCKKEYFADTKDHGGNNGDVVVVPWKVDQEECRKALCRMVIIDELPFKFVEKEGFKQFMKVAQPCFHIPSRTTLTRDCFDLFDEEKRKLMAVFKETQQRVFCPITSHRGEDLEKPISKCLHEWGLHRIFTVTIDNSGSNGVAITELSKQLTKWGTNLMGGSHLHIRCMDHIVNLIVQDGTKEANMSIERVRRAVTYIRQSLAWK